MIPRYSEFIKLAISCLCLVTYDSWCPYDFPLISHLDDLIEVIRELMIKIN